MKNRNLINNLYFIAIWGVSAWGFALLVNDTWRGFGIASCLTLYYILQGKQREENLLGEFYDQSQQN